MNCLPVCVLLFDESMKPSVFVLARRAAMYNVPHINVVERMDLWSISRIVWYVQAGKRCISHPQNMICSANLVAMQAKYCHTANCYSAFGDRIIAVKIH